MYMGALCCCPRYDPLFIIPLLQVNFILFAIVSGGIYFQEFGYFRPLNTAGFLCGVSLLVFGIFLLSPKMAVDESRHSMSGDSGFSSSGDANSDAIGDGSGEDGSGTGIVASAPPRTPRTPRTPPRPSPRPSPQQPSPAQQDEETKEEAATSEEATAMSSVVGGGSGYVCVGEGGGEDCNGGDGGDGGGEASFALEGGGFDASPHGARGRSLSSPHLVERRGLKRNASSDDLEGGGGTGTGTGTAGAEDGGAEGLDPGLLSPLERQASMLPRSNSLPRDGEHGDPLASPGGEQQGALDNTPLDTLVHNISDMADTLTGGLSDVGYAVFDQAGRGLRAASHIRSARVPFLRGVVPSSSSSSLLLLLSYTCAA